MATPKIVLHLDNVEILDVDSVISKRKKRRLLRGFNPNKSGDLENLVDLYCCAYVSDRRDDIVATSLQIKDYFPKNEDRLYLWEDYVRLFLFYWEVVNSKSEKFTVRELILERAEFWESGYILEEYRYFVEQSFHENVVVASVESQKYQCDHFSGNLCELLRFKFACTESQTLDSKYLVEIELMLQVTIEYLVQILVKKVLYDPEDVYEELPRHIYIKGIQTIRQYHFHE